MCLPRILNYSFNPISVFILYDKREIPSGVILEVNNTFKERHLYFSKVKKDQTNFIFDKKLLISSAIKPGPASKPISLCNQDAAAAAS